MNLALSIAILSNLLHTASSFGVLPYISHHDARCPVSSAVTSSASSAEFSVDTTGGAGMDKLQELDSLTVQVIVDNESDTFSTGITDVEGFQYIPERRGRTIRRFGDSGGADDMCTACHGLSLLLTAQCNDKKHTLLLDAGPRPDIWRQNAAKLDIDLVNIDAAVLSHYHYDHSAGLRGAVPAIVDSKEKLKLAKRNSTTGGRSDLLVDLHPSQIVARGRITSTAEQDEQKITKHMPDNPSAVELSNYGANIELHDMPHTLCDDCFYVSGQIPRETTYEKGLASHVTSVGGKWLLDPDLFDERYVCCKIRGRGLVLFSSCSHAGIVNVCRDAIKRTASYGLPVFGVVGGLHLGGANENRISDTVCDLKDMSPAVVIAGHCTGWRAKAALGEAFEGHFQPLAVGGSYIFHS